MKFKLLSNLRDRPKANLSFRLGMIWRRSRLLASQMLRKLRLWRDPAQATQGENRLLL